MTSYRFSIEWSKIFPKRGVPDPAAIRHYHDVLDELVLQELTPMITWHHFTNPIWAEEKGGWEWDEMPDAFLEFVKLTFAEYGSKCKEWVTFNEPEGYAWCGWNLGLHPPGKSFSSILRQAQWF
jgi:beta-glucosidase